MSLQQRPETMKARRALYRRLSNLRRLDNQGFCKVGCDLC